MSFAAGVDMPVELRNTNELLDQEGIDGVKTGRTGRAGDCLILSAERRPEVQRQGENVYVTPRRIVIVMLGSRDRFVEGMALGASRLGPLRPVGCRRTKNQEKRGTLAMQKMRIGVLTSGGDCPGLNAVIRGICRAAYKLGVGGSRVQRWL